MAGAVPAGRAYILLQIRDQVSQGLKTMERKFRQFGSSVSLTGGIAFAAAGGVMSWPLKLAGDMEQTTTSFKVFLGSAEKAKALVKTLDDISLTTPYEISTLAEAARLLLASNLEDSQIPDMLSMIGDLAQGDAESMYLLSKAFADVAQNGKLMAQENNQFRNSGFNVLSVLAEQQAAIKGGSKEQYMPELRKQMEEGVISVWQVAEAMRIATSAGGNFHGMQIEQANTFKGLMSTLWDYVNRGLRVFGDTMMPVAKTVIRLGMGVADGVGQMITKFQQFFRVVGVGLMLFVAFAGLTAVVGGGILALSFVIGVLGSIFATVATVGFVIFAAALSWVGGILLWVGIAAYYFRNEIYALAYALYTAWTPAIASIQKMYGTFVTAIYGIGEALTQGKFQEAWDIALKGMEATFYELLNVVSWVGQMLIDKLLSVFPAFRGVVLFAQDMMGGIYNAILGGRLDLAWAMVWMKIRSAWEHGMGYVMGAWSYLSYGFRVSAVVLEAVFKTLGNSIMLIFESAFYAVQKSAAEIVRVIGIALDAVGQGEAVAGLYDSIKPNEDMNQIIARRLAMQGQINAEAQKGAVNAAGQYAEEQANIQARLDAVRLAEELLEKQARQAREDGGIDSFAERAAKAREELEAAVKAVERPGVEPTNTKNPINKAKGLLNQDDLMGQYMKSNARGTYSAIAATYLGREANDYEKQTADNTKKTVDALNNLNVAFQ